MNVPEKFEKTIDAKARCYAEIERTADRRDIAYRAWLKGFYAGLEFAETQKPL